MYLNHKYIKGKDSKKTVVFLHGFLESLNMWEQFDFEQFNFDSLLIDLPGHGESDNEDEEEPSIQFFSIKVKEVLSYLSLVNVDVVGHSMGGYVALNLKTLYPTYISKIVLLNSNFWGDDEKKKKDRIRVAEIVRDNKLFFLKESISNLFPDNIKFKLHIDKLIREASKMDAFNIAYASLAMRNRDDYTIFISSLIKDLFIIQGDKDKVIPLEQMKDNIEGLNVNLKVVKNTGHMSPIESANTVFSYINNYI